MGCDSVVPNRYRVRGPMQASLEIAGLRHVVVKEVQDSIYGFGLSEGRSKAHEDFRTRLFLLQADDAPRELLVHIKCFLSRNWVLPDHRMNILNRLAPHDTTTFSRTRVIGLLHARMDSLQGPEERNELRRQFLESGDLRSE